MSGNEVPTNANKCIRNDNAEVNESRYKKYRFKNIPLRKLEKQLFRRL